MVLKSDQERVMALLKDTITLLCKNGLNFKTKFCIDAVIGVTVDEEELFYVSVKEVVKTEKGGETKSDSSGEEASELGESPRKRRRKRRLKAGGDESNGEYGGDGLGLDEDGAQASASFSGMEGGQQNPAADKRPRIKNEDGGENSDEDIMFIKQELDENSAWSQRSEDTSSALMYQGFGGHSGTDSQQDQNFPSLSDMTLMPIDSGEGPSGTWSNQQQQPRQFKPRGPRMSSSTLESSQLQPGDGPDNQQVYKTAQRYECHLCNKTFSQYGNLRQHINLHGGLFRHYCTYCNKGFMTPSALKGHLAIHTGRRDFKCTRCGTTYSYKNHLKRHMLSCKD